MYTAYGFRDTHGMTNSFTCGFDGWIYACHGFSNESTVKGKDGQPIVMQLGQHLPVQARRLARRVLHPRPGEPVRPLRSTRSATCTRPTATRGRFTMLLPGAYYPSFGKPDDGLGFGPEMVTHDHGSTGIAGVAYYAAEHFPKAYQRQHLHRQRRDEPDQPRHIEWHGSSPKGDRPAGFPRQRRPLVPARGHGAGAGRALYVADFYNRIIGHYEVPLTHPGRDRDRGRIWRIVYKGDDKSAKPLRPGYDGTRESVDELVKALGDPNLVRRTHATNMLVEKGRGNAQAVKHAMGDENPTRRVHALWTQNRLGMLRHGGVLEASFDKSAEVRIHALTSSASGATETRACVSALAQAARPGPAGPTGRGPGDCRASVPRKRPRPVCALTSPQRATLT